MSVSGYIFHLKLRFVISVLLLSNICNAKIKGELAESYLCGKSTEALPSITTKIEEKKLPEDVEKLLTCLENAYKNNSQTDLEAFYEEWQKEIPPVTVNELNRMSDSVRLIYNLFYDLYQPPKVHQPNANKKYYLVQNKIEAFAVSDTSLVITDFRPMIQEQHKALYLSEKYSQVLYEFIYRYPESSDFLNLDVIDEIGYEIHTSPYVTLISFEEIDEVYVYFRGGLITLKKKWIPSYKS